jgi:hypothetical protein
MRAAGLTKVPNADLESLLRRIHRGELRCPFRRSDLLLAGMNHLADEGDLLIGLPEPGVRAVILAVLAERRARTRTSASAPG